MKNQLLCTLTLFLLITSNISLCVDESQPSYWQQFKTWIDSSSQARENAIRTALVPITWGFALNTGLTTEQTAALYGMQGAIIRRALQTKGSISWKDLKTVLITGLATAGIVAIAKPFVNELNRLTPRRMTLKDAIDLVKDTITDNQLLTTNQAKINALETQIKNSLQEISRRSQNRLLGATYNIETWIQACNVVIQELEESK